MYVDEALDDGGAGGGGAQAALLELAAQLLVLHEAAGVFHRAQQRVFGVGLGGLGLFAEDLGRFDADGLALLQRGEGGLVLVLLGAQGRVGGVPARGDLGLAAREEAVLAHAGDGGHGIVDIVGVEGGDELADHHFIQLLLVGREAGSAAGGHDGVVVGELFVVVDALAGVDAVALGRDERGKGLGQGVQHLADLGAHVLGEVARIGAGIGEHLVFFVEGLGQVEGFLGGEAVAGVGLALERGQVVEQRRRYALALGGDLLHGALAALDGLRDGLSLLGGCDAGLVVRVDPQAGVIAEIGLDLVVVLGHEIADLQLAPDQQGERGRLDAADGEQAVVAQREGAGAVHAHEPVGVGAALGGQVEVVVFAAVLDAAEALGDGLLGHGGDPETGEGLFTARHFIDAAEDQLALAAGVGGADDAVDLGGVEYGLDVLVLLAHMLFGDDLEGDLVGEYGQGIGAPILPAGVDLVGVELGDEVPHRPGHDVAAALEAALAGRIGTQHAGDVPRDGGLFGNDAGKAHGGQLLSGGLQLKFDLAIVAEMAFSAIDFFLCGIGFVHAALFQHAAAGGVFRKIACGHFAKAHIAQLAQQRPDGFGRAALPLMVGMDHIADLDLLVPDPAVVDKADERVLQIDAVLEVRGILDPAEGDQLLGESFELLR